MLKILKAIPFLTVLFLSFVFFMKGSSALGFLILIGIGLPFGLFLLEGYLEGETSDSFESENTLEELHSGSRDYVTNADSSLIGKNGLPLSSETGLDCLGGSIASSGRID